MVAVTAMVGSMGKGERVESVGSVGKRAEMQ